MAEMKWMVCLRLLSGFVALSFFLAGSVSAVEPSLVSFRQGNTLTLQWHTNYPGYQLEYAVRLLATNWIRVTNTPIVGQWFTATDSATNVGRFYRLRCGPGGPPIPVVVVNEYWLTD